MKSEQPIEKFLAFLRQLPPHIGVRVNADRVHSWLRIDQRRLSYLEAEAAEAQRGCEFDYLGETFIFGAVR